MSKQDTAKKKITMGELARLAKVDISTVSRALNDSPLVKDKTKEKVRSIAQELGYEINASGRNLRKKSTQTLGMVIPIDPARGQTISDPFYLEMVGAVSHAASKRDYDLLVTVPQSDESVAERRLLQTGKADGLIVIGQAGRAERLNALAEVTDKFVVWGGRLGNVNYTLIGSDNVAGGRAAASHLLSQGRRRILFIGDVSLPEVALRYQGYAAAHEARDMGTDPQLILPLSFGAMTAARDVVQFLREGPGFDSIFAASDVLAMAAMHALGSCGVTVPESVAVVGYDNIGQSALVTPALTTIDQNIALGGEALVNHLLRKTQGQQVQDQMMPTQLVVRQSSV